MRDLAKSWQVSAWEWSDIKVEKLIWESHANSVAIHRKPGRTDPSSRRRSKARVRKVGMNGGALFLIRYYRVTRTSFRFTLMSAFHPALQTSWKSNNYKRKGVQGVRKGIFFTKCVWNIIYVYLITHNLNYLFLFE